MALRGSRINKFLELWLYSGFRRFAHLSFIHQFSKRVLLVYLFLSNLSDWLISLEFKIWNSWNHIVNTSFYLTSLSACSLFLVTRSRKEDPIAWRKLGSANGVLAADRTSFDTTSSSYIKTPSPLSTRMVLVVPLKLLAAAGATTLALNFCKATQKTWQHVRKTKVRSAN